MSELAMTPSDFQNFKTDLLKILESEEKLWGFREQINRLISHVESEQRISMAHGTDINELKGAVLDTNSSVGLRTWRRETEDLIRELKWMVRAIVTAVLALIGNVVYQAITNGHHP
jgi:hypothetical protein